MLRVNVLYVFVGREQGLALDGCDALRKDLEGLFEVGLLAFLAVLECQAELLRLLKFWLKCKSFHLLMKRSFPDVQAETKAI